MDLIPVILRYVRREVKLANKGELSFPHYRLLVYIARGPKTNREVAEWQGVSTAAASRMVDGLIRRGLLERRVDESDHRAVNIALTPRGKSAFESVRAVLVDKIAKKISGLSSKDKAALEHGLTLLEEIFS